MEGLDKLSTLLWMVTGDLQNASISLAVFLSGILLSSVLSRHCAHLADRLFPLATRGAKLLFERVARLGVLSVTTLAALELLGLDITSLLTAGTVVLVGVGLALQQITRSVVAGMLLLVERELEPGDVIVWGGEHWRVAHIHLRTTMLENHLDETLIIPNYLLASQTVRNLTHRNSRFRIHCDVGVAYTTDVEEAISALTRAAEQIPGRDPDEPPVVLMRAFGSSAIEFTVRVAILEPWQAPELSSLLHRAVRRELAAAAITIPFPQLDLHQR